MKATRQKYAAPFSVQKQETLGQNQPFFSQVASHKPATACWIWRLEKLPQFCTGVFTVPYWHLQQLGLPVSFLAHHPSIHTKRVKRMVLLSSYILLFGPFVGPLSFLRRSLSWMAWGSGVHRFPWLASLVFLLMFFTPFNVKAQVNRIIFIFAFSLQGEQREGLPLSLWKVLSRAC